MIFTADREEFATSQTKIQVKDENYLIGSARSALRRYGQKDWYSALLKRVEQVARTAYRREAGHTSSDTLRSALRDMRKAVSESLDKTQKPAAGDINVRAKAIAASLAAYANAVGVEAAAKVDDEDIALEWVTMHDSKVRTTHREADGQTRRPGEKYDVGGTKMSGPGDVTVPIELWINCRCALRPTKAKSLAAAGTEYEDQGLGIFLLPSADDPIQSISTENPPHVTTIWMGMYDSDREVALSDIKQDLQAVAGQFAPVDVDVKARDTLGDEGADVAFLNRDQLVELRDALLSHQTIADTMNEVEQFPEWLPHLTLGYPETPANEGDLPSTVRLDRLALFVGRNHYEYPLGGEMTATVEAAAQVEEDNIDDIGEIDVVEPVPWHGVLAPEGVLSGDARKFKADSLTWRDLPLPLRWQKEDWGAHDGAVTVGRIDRIYREDGLVWGEGEMLRIPEADEAIQMMAEGGLRGVSVDADKASMSFEDEDGNVLTLDSEIGPDTLVVTSFDEARISGATLCAIPAFQEAFISLGMRPVEGEAVAATGETETFVKTEDGPGWLTHPVDTERLRRYWTKGEGAAKIGWGTPGDFNRCRAQLAKYVKPQYLAGYCANRHYDALGFWPGRPVSGDTVTFAISEKSWDGSDSRFDIEEWKRSCILDTGEGDPNSKSRYKLPIKEPNGDLSRAAVHNAASRINQVDASSAAISKAKAALRRAYGTLGEDVPDSLKAASLYLVASGSDRKYPRSWFEDPQFTGPSRMAITEEGHIFGHMAQWGVCHIGITNVCTEAPSSFSDYAYFATGTVDTDEGPVAVGSLTMGCGHAGPKANAAVAAAHYDNLGWVIADVAMGEDEFGIWYAGAIRPEATEEQIAALRASGSVSGDWRTIGGHLEAVAALIVNVPGFPITPTQLAASGGQQTSLVAAGIVTPEVSQKTLREIVAAAVEDHFKDNERRQKMADLKQRLGRDAKSKMAALAAGRG